MAPRSHHAGRLLGEPRLELGALVTELARCGHRSCGRWPETMGVGAPVRPDRASPTARVGPPAGAAPASASGCPGPRASSATMSAGEPDHRIGEIHDLVADHQAGPVASRLSGPGRAYPAHQSHGPKPTGPVRSYTRAMAGPPPPLPPRRRTLPRPDGPDHRLIVGDRGGHRAAVRRLGGDRGHQLVDVGGGGRGSGRRAPRSQLRAGRRRRRGPGPTAHRRGGGPPRPSRCAGQQRRNHRGHPPCRPRGRHRPTCGGASSTSMSSAPGRSRWPPSTTCAPQDGVRSSTSPRWPASGRPGVRSPTRARRRRSAT